MTIDPVYTPDPLTQRDGSALANSNCRPTSIAVGIQYQERVKSSGSKMRGYMSDQSGGTDSGDAVEAWRKGYSADLTVRDGYTFDNALQDLAKGSAVHIDVWHASCGSQVCQSGSGQYGHTMFILPDQHSDGVRWKVCDPWCSPPAWVWVDEGKLRAGAEEWGRRVYGTAVMDADYPTSGSGDIGDPRHPVALAIARRVTRLLMDAAHPGAEDTGPGPKTPRDWGETGGGPPVMFTRTAALGLAGGGSSGGGGGDVARFVQSNGYGAGSRKVLHVAAGTPWYYLDGAKGGEFSGVADLAVLGMVDGHSGDWAVLLSTGAPYADHDQRTTVAWVKGGTPTDAPTPEPPPAGGGDIEARDEEWRAWVLEGSPGS